jgi:glycosyltransferase involved in cell wall biosynthesis
MRSLPRLLEQVPGAEVIIIGEAGRAGYGAAAPAGKTWAEVLVEEAGDKFDAARVHFAGRVPYETFIDVLSLSWAHVYFTYPFVMSWSLLEAMACECLIVGSDTGPVRDAVSQGENGLLLDFFDHARLSATLIEACRTPARFAQLRQAARQTIEDRYDRTRTSVPAWLDLIDRQLALGGRG